MFVRIDDGRVLLIWMTFVQKKPIDRNTRQTLPRLVNMSCSLYISDGETPTGSRSASFREYRLPQIRCNYYDT